MKSKHQQELTFQLLSEYKKGATRKIYRGTNLNLHGKEGFAWRSQIMKRWCFLPLKTDFTLDQIIRVDNKNLFNL